MITTGLDHTLIATPDLEAGHRELESLGFYVTPRAMHENFGTANRLAVLRDHYLELITVENRSPRDMSSQVALRPALASGGGIPMLGLATDDPAASHKALVDANVETAEPLTWSRPADTPDGMKTASFTTIFLRSELLPGFQAFVCQHHTPELVWHAQWLNHPNGAVRLIGIERETSDDLAGVAARLHSRFGDAAVTTGPKAVQVLLGRHLIRYRSGEKDGYCTTMIGVESLERAGAVLGARVEASGPDGLRVALRSTRASLLFVKDGTWP